MTTGDATWYSEFLDPDEPAVIAFESTKEPGMAEIAVAGAFGLVGGAIGAAAGSAVAQTMSPSTYQKAPGDWVGMVVLTQRRLLLVDGHGIARSVDRRAIRAMDLSGSKAGAWHSRIAVTTDAGVCRLHTPLKTAHVLAKHLNHQGSVDVDINEGSAGDILKAIPLIICFFISVIAVVAYVSSGDVIGSVLAFAFLAATEKLRRWLFPSKNKRTASDEAPSKPSTRKWKPPQGQGPTSGS